MAADYSPENILSITKELKEKYNKRYNGNVPFDITPAIVSFAIWWAYTHPRWRITPSHHRITESIVALLCIPVIIIGIRGGLGESTTNIGQVYFSQNQFMNHSAVNPVFNFIDSFDKADADYSFMSDEECSKLMS